ncbi:transcription factor atf21 [Colletotrichum abscissum]|uniref:Transcription factor atf21 n=1 Tax=Colletotrichum abscissum TaxID=1671311 RepID=A0A9P9XR17_9PEZI|nr:transcription factor atf21 [Colletotrichum abscissum]
MMTLETESRHKNKADEPGEQSTNWRPRLNKGHRIKNRAAAKRSREKTKQYEQYLVVKEHEIAQERMYLNTCLIALKNEVLTLKNEILQHTGCDCEMIQRYIDKAAHSFGSGVAQSDTEAYLFL